MIGIDGSEIFLLLLLGIVILGPRRLPEVANRIGGWVGQARRMTRVMRRQLEEELDIESYHTPGQHGPRDGDTHSPGRAAAVPDDEEHDTLAPPSADERSA